MSLDQSAQRPQSRIVLSRCVEPSLLGELPQLLIGDVRSIDILFSTLCHETLHATEEAPSCATEWRHVDRVCGIVLVDSCRANALYELIL